MNLDVLLQLMAQLKASELHVTPGLPPIFRVDGNLVPAQSGKLKSDQVKELLAPLISLELETEIMLGNTVNVTIGNEPEQVEVAIRYDNPKWAAAFQRRNITTR